MVPDTLVEVKQDASYFENKEPVLIYIGKKLKDSLRLEEIFTRGQRGLRRRGR